MYNGFVGPRIIVIIFLDYCDDFSERKSRMDLNFVFFSKILLKAHLSEEFKTLRDEKLGQNVAFRKVAKSLLVRVK